MSKTIDEMSPWEIENHLEKRKRDEREIKRRAEYEAKKQFEKNTNFHFYSSSDYIGIESNGLDFYYGYEVTQCPDHKTNAGCENANCNKRVWCFQAKENGIVELTIPQTELWYIPDAVIELYLFSGIAKYLQHKGLTTPTEGSETKD